MLPAFDSNVCVQGAVEVDSSSSEARSDAVTKRRDSDSESSSTSGTVPTSVLAEAASSSATATTSSSTTTTSSTTAPGSPVSHEAAGRRLRETLNAVRQARSAQMPTTAEPPRAAASYHQYYQYPEQYHTRYAPPMASDAVPLQLDAAVKLAPENVERALLIAKANVINDIRLRPVFCCVLC